MAVHTVAHMPAHTTARRLLSYITTIVAIVATIFPPATPGLPLTAVITASVHLSADRRPIYPRDVGVCCKRASRLGERRRECPSVWFGCMESDVGDLESACAWSAVAVQ
mmetsp:Transcript_4180/g.9135  ORF Transcript_4180/g.9135 Transcript_4180/m.9135 type:complete len:109 (+) Transcript_4180:1806-2132(+)